MNLLRRCHDCGQPLGKKDRLCPRCGAKQPREPKRSGNRAPRIYQTT
jgi:predicted amidophosphoribosyltransferase